MKVIIAGGGTGGHVFPAIAIGKELMRQVSGIDILFVGAKDRLEMEKVPAAGFKIIGLWISGFQRKLSFKNLIFPFKLIHSTWKSNQIIKNFKPDVVIGVGGYASGPLLKSAQGKSIPTVILESNSYAGLTNRLLGSKASAICTAFPGMDKFFPASKVFKTGNPVRQEVAKYGGSKELAIRSFELDPTKKTIVVLGGSLD
jgi:UDP-N-acetylglucosamine--N-acetylmuramyl-(pentapeptide) pyrophosphoryl-undecaprenol N-acetylglucosamine transferase